MSLCHSCGNTLVPENEIIFGSIDLERLYFHKNCFICQKCRQKLPNEMKKVRVIKRKPYCLKCIIDPDEVPITE